MFSIDGCAVQFSIWCAVVVATTTWWTDWKSYRNFGFCTLNHTIVVFYGPNTINLLDSGTSNAWIRFRFRSATGNSIAILSSLCRLNNNIFEVTHALNGTHTHTYVWDILANRDKNNKTTIRHMIGEWYGAILCLVVRLAWSWLCKRLTCALAAPFESESRPSI